MRKSKLEVQLNKDIREYTNKLYWGLTGRQIFFGLLGVAAGTGMFIWIMGSLGTTLAAMACVVVMSPLIALGFYRWRGQPFETYLKIMLRDQRTPEFLPYRPDEPACLNPALKNEKKRTERSTTHGKNRKTENAE